MQLNAPPTPRVGDELRVAIVDDHELTLRGFRELIHDADGLELVASAHTVEELIAALATASAPQLVVLDLRLADGSTPTDNVTTLRSLGAHVLVLTAGEDTRLIRAAAHAGVLGMVRKSDPAAELLDAIRDAGRGITVPSTEWAAALDAAADLPSAQLSPREREILALYASGQTTHSVAYTTGLSPSTVADYVSRIRSKYERVGRPAPSRVDLYRRAEEDGYLDGGR